MPPNWPPYYPNDLVPQTMVIVGEAVRKFPEQTHTLQLCNQVISKLTPHFSAAVQDKRLEAGLALSRMSDLLRYLLVYNCDDQSKRYQLELEVMNSNEWLVLAREITRVTSATTQDSSNLADPPGPGSDSAQKPEPRQPLPASVTNVSDPLQAGSGATANRQVKAVFRKSCELWEIGYEDKTSNFRDKNAFHFISKLLRERGIEIPALELAAQVNPGSEGVSNGANFTSEAVREAHLPIRGSLGVGGGGDVDDMTDRQTLEKCRGRLRAIAKERQVAKKNQDSARLTELNEEVEKIEQEIKAATGHGGKIRKFSSPEDRARSNLTKQIKAAIKKISAPNPDLGAHLRQSIKTGKRFSYQPDPATDIHWNL